MGSSVREFPYDPASWLIKMESPQEKKTWLVVSVVAIALFILLRYDGLCDHCLWFDEIYSSHAASMKLSEMFPFIARDLVHPPLFYVLLNLWTSLFGDSLTALRAFPFTISLISLAPAYLLLKQLKVGPIGIATGLVFIAANGILIKYSQEVRMYSLVVGLSFASTFLFQRFFRMGKGIVALTVVNVLLLTTHYFGFVLIVSQILAVLVWQRIKMRTITLSGGASLSVVAGWLLYASGFSGEGRGLEENIGWIPIPDLFTIANSFFDFIEPIYFEMSSADFQTNPLISIPMLLLVIAAIAVVISKGGRKEIKSGEGLFPQAGIFIFGVLLTFGLSLILPYSVWGSRHLLVLFGPFVAVIAIALTSDAHGRYKLIPVATFFSIVLMAVAVGFLQPRENRHIWCAWEKFASYLDERPNQGAPVYFVDDLAAYHFWYFSRHSDARQVFLLRNDSIGPLDAAYFLPRGFEGVTKTDGIDEEGPFLVGFTAKSWDEDAEPLKTLRSRGCSPEVLEIFEANNRSAFLVRCD